MLSLFRTKLTDAGLNELKALENLRNFYDGQTNVTDAGRAAFKAALPNCNR